MSATGTIRIIWSNGEDDFCAAKIGTILQLEDKCRAGIAAILLRLESGTWFINDVRETIRLGLIGAGMPADQAQKVVELHVHGHPRGLQESIQVAHRILQAVIIGVPDDPVGKETAAEATGHPSSLKTDASAAPSSTASGNRSATRRVRPTK